MKNNKGFTLIELLVVVLIIGILAAIALPQYMKAVAKSRVSDAFATMKAISGAEQRYFLAKGEYTDNFADLDIEFSGAGTTSSYANTATGFTYTLNKTGDGLVTATGNTSLGGTTLTQNFTTNAISFTSDPKGICASFSGVTCPTE